MASWARCGGLKEESRTAMWGTEWGDEVLNSRGQFDGAYSRVKDAELDVA